MNEKYEQLKKDLPFDLFGRYAVICDIINENRENGEKFKILDVGGRGNLLRKFLHEDEVFYMDPFVESNDKNFIKGDGCDIPLAENNFDWVVSADVFEHIPKEKRESFLRENIRVSKLGVVLVAPFWSKEVEIAEFNANETYKRFSGGKNHGWLEEHIKNGLPKEKEVEDFLKNEALDFQKLHNNRLFLWESLLGMDFFISNNFNEEIENRLKKFNYFYNSEIFPYDNEGPSYRKIYFIKKNKKLKNVSLGNEMPNYHIFFNVFKRALDIVERAGEINKINCCIIKQKEIKRDEEIQRKNAEIQRKDTEIQLMRSSKFWKLREWNEKIKFVIFQPHEAFKKHKSRLYFAIFHPIRFVKKYKILIKKVLNEDEGMVFKLKATPLKQGDNLKNSISGIKFPVSSNPMVSVVIPFYKKQLATIVRCLESVYKNKPNVPFEIIIVNNNFSDDSENILGKIEGIKVIFDKENQDYIHSCNVGAKAAKGEFLCFLNSSTEVTYDWMDSLLNIFHDFPNAGLVGSKLVNSNEKLQEAGEIIWKDGSATIFGNGENPMLPRFNYVRKVDCCSITSSIIRKKIFNEIGGFDESYASKHLGNLSSCLEIIKKKYDIMYQPLSLVICHENTAVSDMPLCRNDDFEKFYAKHGDFLFLNNFEKDKCFFWARERSKGKKTALVIDRHVPTFDKDAGSRTVYQYIKLLCDLDYNVKFIGDNFLKMEPYTTNLQQMGVEVLYGKYFEKNWVEWLKKNKKYIDFVFLNRPDIFKKYINRVRENTNAKIIYYGHDLHFLRIKREYDVTKANNLLEESEAWKKIEFDIFQKSDISLYPSKIEIDEISKNMPNVKTDILTAYMYNNKKYNYKAEERENMLFVGGFNHLPNVDAVKWFCKNIFPKVLQKNPLIKLYIVGSNPTKEILNLESNSVIVKGFVTDEELAKIYDKVRMSIVPLRYGAGIKGKIIEAMYREIPVVTTSCGAEGINDDSEMFAIADQADDMANKICDLYDNFEKLNLMSTVGKEFINKNYSIESAIKKIRNIF